MWACFSLSAGGGGCASQGGGGEHLVVREAVRGAEHEKRALYGAFSMLSRWEKGRAGARVKECQ